MSKKDGMGLLGDSKALADNGHVGIVSLEGPENYSCL